MLKWLYNELNCPYNEYISSYAVFSNSIEILEWLYKNNIKIHEYSYATAIDYNNINILNWLYQKKIKFTNLTVEYAINSGNIKIIEWLYKRNCTFNSNSLNIACKIGNLDIILFLNKIGIQPNSNTFNIACENGTRLIICILINLNCEIYSSCYLHIIKSKKYENLDWLYNIINYKIIFDNNLLEQSFRLNDRIGIEWLISKKCYISDNDRLYLNENNIDFYW